LFEFLPQISAVSLLHVALIVLIVPAVLFQKRDSTVAVAWCLVVIFLPMLGALLYWTIGFNYLHRRVRRKRRHRLRFPQAHPPQTREATRGKPDTETIHPLARVALAVNAFPVSAGNAVQLYHETEQAFAALLDAITAARHHVHLEFFIVRSDGTGRRLFELLTEKARAGVEVRLLYDSAGTLFVARDLLRALLEAGGRVAAFLPVNPVRSWVQVNLRNHRKIVVMDGKAAFTGGMNVGDEYLGKGRVFPYWRDSFMEVRGPAVAGLQRIFTEDWDFATGEGLNGTVYYPELETAGEHAVQVIDSGPDQDFNGIREVYFAAILSAKERVWIASPYFVPDAGLLDAMRLASYRGVDVRLLCLLRGDHILSFYASRYYFRDALSAGVKVYQYAKGMMHSKLMMVDGSWAMVGSANLDNRSLRLNFEVGCMLYAPTQVNELEERFRADLAVSVPVDPQAFAARPFRLRLMENACRLFSPVL
jgi:cardiolipin synthase